MTPSAWAYLADFLVLIHFAFVSFVVIGLPVIWLGYFLRWSWVRNFWFRAVHILFMAIVVFEALAGITCPLTTWENKARLRAGQVGYREEGFIEHWTHKLMFFRCDPSTFTVIYVVFFLLLVGSLIFIRPRRPFPKRQALTTGTAEDDEPS